MKVCLVAIAVGCKNCPVVTLCPLKTIIGDYRRDDAGSQSDTAKAAGRPKK